jgi:23S rRNA (uridine2479-2'-O)-methyltransferase
MRPLTIQIRSENNDFQHAEVLSRNREKRQRHREFFVEGVKAIELCIERGWSVSTYIHSSERKLSGWAKDILATSTAERHLVMPQALMDKLSDKNDTSELLALVKMPDDDLERIRLTEPGLVVVLDRPSSPGNLGTVLRTSNAMRVDGVIITGHAVDLYDPKTIRASVGTLFCTPVVRIESSKVLEPWIARLKAESGVTVVGTSARAPEVLAEHDFRRPTLLLFGNETSGLSVHCRSLCDSLVTIPIHGAASSLNVACAASITLYEIDRQRRPGAQ